MKQQIPSKIFLLGEYLALTGGPSLVITAPPYFTLTAQPSDEWQITGINHDSPAGRYLAMFTKQQPPQQVTFNDPHHGQGGFGASSGQFLGVYRYLHPHIDNTQLYYQELLKHYRDYATTANAIPPSGADMIAQTQADGIILYQESPFILQHHHWPFRDLTFQIARTGNKVATHQHLAELNNIPTKALANIMSSAINAFHQADSEQFCKAINNYQQILITHGLIHPTTLSLLANWRKKPGIKAVKGCGALGADVILIVADASQSDL